MEPLDKAELDAFADMVAAILGDFADAVRAVEVPAAEGSGPPLVVLVEALRRKDDRREGYWFDRHLWDAYPREDLAGMVAGMLREPVPEE